jgi:hypothetical protein
LTGCPSRPSLERGSPESASARDRIVETAYQLFSRHGVRAVGIEPDFEGCSFINVLIEIDDPGHVLHAAATRHFASIRAFLRSRSQQAGVRDPDTFSRQWYLLMKGSIVAAGEGDVGAARCANDLWDLPTDPDVHDRFFDGR